MTTPYDLRYEGDRLALAEEESRARVQRILDEAEARADREHAARMRIIKAPDFDFETTYAREFAGEEMSDEAREDARWDVEMDGIVYGVAVPETN